MTSQFQMKAGVAALRKAIQDAWATDSEHEAHLCSSSGNPGLIEQRLNEQVWDIYIRVALLLEASGLPGLLAEMKADLEDFRQTRQVKFSSSEYGTLDCRTLQLIGSYVSPLMEATASGSDWPDDFLLLERILIGIPRLLRDFGIEPRKEADVRNALYYQLVHVFPETKREVPVPKIGQTYKIDIGVISLRAGVEIKFCDSEREMKRAVGGVFEDVNGYSGSEDWKYFYALFYMTDAFMTQAQLEEEFREAQIDHSWKPLVVQGRGRRK